MKTIKIVSSLFNASVLAAAYDETIDVVTVGVKSDDDGTGLIVLGGDDARKLRDFLNEAMPVKGTPEPTSMSLPKFAHPTPKPAPQRRLSNLTPQAQLVYRHMQRAGSISAREAMADHGITSASLARRICDIEGEGFKVSRDRRRHPLTGKEFTRYALVEQ